MNEVTSFPLWLTIFLAAWAAVGPVAGILIGHYLTRSWQRKQWIADNQKAEYRKILSGLNRLNVALVRRCSGVPVDQKEIDTATEEMTMAANTSLFIIDFLQESEVMGDVIQAVRHLGTPGTGFETYQKQYWKAVSLITSSARKCSP